MAIIIEQDIFRFEIAVDESKGMKVPKGKANLSNIKLCKRDLEFFLVLKVEEQLPATVEIQNKVELFRGLESEAQLHQERVLEGLQDLPLGLCMLDLVTLHNRLFLQDLHRINLSVLLPSDLHDFAEAAATKYFQELEIGDGYLVRSLYHLFCRQLVFGCLRFIGFHFLVTVVFSDFFHVVPAFPEDLLAVLRVFGDDILPKV
mmetsp:Transcript_22169/g.43109  ORF Transcript_22169/g.43109 Transcript_22169/m.43109 type:complete len:203 (-) Transcript_22169:488-1096(-)